MSNLKLANNAISRLSAGISDVATNVSVMPGDGAKYPALTAGQYFPATFIRASDGAVEIVKVTARATDVLTIVRAQEGTAALTLLASDRIEVRLTAATFIDEIARVEAIASAALPKAGGVMTGDLTMGAGTKIVLEGTTDDAFEMTIDPGNPTADRTMTLPDKSGTVATTDDVTNARTMTGDLTMGAGTKVVFEGATNDSFETALDVVDPTQDNVVLLPNKSGTLATLDDLSSKIQPISAVAAANAMTLTLNPTTLDFRSATLGSGAVNTRRVASAISTVISSGSTGGTSNALASRIILLAIDNAGTVELAWVNQAGGVNLDETTLITTVAEGGAGAADSASTIYSTTARTNVPFRVVGYFDSTQAVAGTWATQPSAIQGAGGQALQALSSLGYGQLPVNVTASRSASTTYYNTTGKPIIAVIGSLSAGGGTSISATVNGVAFPPQTVNVISSAATVTLLIPPGASYSVSVVGTLGVWIEYR